MPQNTNESQVIRNLQTYLRQLAYHDSGITAPPVDGVFAGTTQQAVKDFQKMHGLPETGVVNERVWDLLYASYRSSLAANSAPERINIFPLYPSNCEFQLGNRSFLIAALQYILQELERMYGCIGNPEITGVYDEQTANSVLRFQKQNALRTSGCVNRLTWNALADQYNMLSAQYPKE